VKLIDFSLPRGCELNCLVFRRRFGTSPECRRQAAISPASLAERACQVPTPRLSQWMSSESPIRSRSDCRIRRRKQERRLRLPRARRRLCGRPTADGESRCGWWGGSASSRLRGLRGLALGLPALVLSRSLLDRDDDLGAFPAEALQIEVLDELGQRGLPGLLVVVSSLPSLFGFIPSSRAICT